MQPACLTDSYLFGIMNIEDKNLHKYLPLSKENNFAEIFDFEIDKENRDKIAYPIIF